MFVDDKYQHYSGQPSVFFMVFSITIKLFYLNHLYQPIPT